MQALSSFPSPSSDTSNSQARAVLSKDEENMKSPVNKILRRECYFRVPGDGWLGPTFVFWRYGPRIQRDTRRWSCPTSWWWSPPRRWWRRCPAPPHSWCNSSGPWGGRRIVTLLAIKTLSIFYLLQDPQTLRLLSLGGPHPGRGVLAAGDQHAAVLRQAHAVDALLVVGHRLQELAFLSSSGSSCPHGGGVWCEVCCNWWELWQF